jgi:hypothetical protein
VAIGVKIVTPATAAEATAATNAAIRARSDITLEVSRLEFRGGPGDYGRTAVMLWPEPPSSEAEQARRRVEEAGRRHEWE